MNPLLTVALLLVAHFVADFLLQSHEMARKKSVEIAVLLQHVAIHFGLTAVALWSVVGLGPAVLGAVVVAVLHGVIDWNVWRGYKQYVAERTDADTFEWWNDHWYYVVIGLDQLLHGLTLLLALFLVSPR